MAYEDSSFSTGRCSPRALPCRRRSRSTPSRASSPNTSSIARGDSSSRSVREGAGDDEPELPLGTSALEDRSPTISQTGADETIGPLKRVGCERRGRSSAVGNDEDERRRAAGRDRKSDLARVGYDAALVVGHTTRKGACVGFGGVRRGNPCDQPRRRLPNHLRRVLSQQRALAGTAVAPT